MMNSSTIRPGLLVSLKSSLVGGVRYDRTDIEAEHAEGAARVARWETRREIVDAEEHARAVVARGKARSIISRICCPTSFGLLCPVARESELSEAINEARGVVNAHNSTARSTRVEIYCLTGRIADSDEEASRAIASDVRELLDSMQSGVRELDPEKIRDAANRARAMAGMLAPEVQGAVGKAIDEVRSIARKIVKAAGDSGETAALEVDTLKLEALQAARFCVLDLDETAAPPAATQAAQVAALDFEPAAPAPVSAPAPRPAFEIDAAPGFEAEGAKVSSMAQQRDDMTPPPVSAAGPVRSLDLF